MRTGPEHQPAWSERKVREFSDLVAEGEKIKFYRKDSDISRKYIKTIKWNR